MYNKKNILIDDNKKIKDNINNPKNIKLLTKLNIKSYSFECLDNTFCIFKCINDILCLIYTNFFKSIISYNILDKKIITEIKNAHSELIINFRHFLDKLDKRDLILSVSRDSRDLKVWNFNNLECLVYIKNLSKINCLYSACILHDNNQNYIVISTNNIITYNFDSIKIKEIKERKDYNTSFFVDNFYDNKLNKNYIIIGCYGCVKSYDFNLNKIYHMYSSNDIKYEHFSSIINKRKEVVELIESSIDGYIRIWNFHSGKLLNEIQVNDGFLYGICLWNSEYLFVGCGDDNIIKLIDLKNGKNIKDLEGHFNDVICVKKIFHPLYGECLISQQYQLGPIFIWSNKI